jgi:hypothetical protein
VVIAIATETRSVEKQPYAETIKQIEPTLDSIRFQA